MATNRVLRIDSEAVTNVHIAPDSTHSSTRNSSRPLSGGRPPKKVLPLAAVQRPQLRKVSRSNPIPSKEPLKPKPIPTQSPDYKDNQPFIPPPPPQPYRQQSSKSTGPYASRLRMSQTSSLGDSSVPSTSHGQLQKSATVTDMNAFVTSILTTRAETDHYSRSQNSSPRIPKRAQTPTMHMGLNGQHELKLRVPRNGQKQNLNNHSNGNQHQPQRQHQRQHHNNHQRQHSPQGRQPQFAQHNNAQNLVKHMYHDSHGPFSHSANNMHQHKKNGRPQQNEQIQKPNRANNDSSQSSEPNESDVKQLMSMGFDAVAAETALVASHNRVALAAQYLIEAQTEKEENNKLPPSNPRSRQKKSSTRTERQLNKTLTKEHSGSEPTYSRATSHPVNFGRKTISDESKHEPSPSAKSRPKLNILSTTINLDKDQRILDLRDEIEHLQTLLWEKQKKLVGFEKERLENHLENMKPIALMKSFNSFVTVANEKELNLMLAVLAEKI